MTENCSYYLKMDTIVLVLLFRDFAKMNTIVLDTIVLIDCIYENHLLGEINLALSFCSVQFRGDFYVVNQEVLGPWQLQINTP